MGEYQGQESIRYPSCVFNYGNGKLISIGFEGELYVRRLARTCYAVPHYNLTVGNNFLKISGFDCSECGGRLDLPVKVNFCPTCGAKVVDKCETC